MPAHAAGRKVRDADEAKQLLAAWSRSGVPMATWCKQRGVSWYSLAAFKGWPKRALVSGQAPKSQDLQDVAEASHRNPDGRATYTELVEASPAFIEVDTTASVYNNDAQPLYRVRVGSYTVETSSSFDEDSLRRLLLLVASC